MLDTRDRKSKLYTSLKQSFEDVNRWEIVPLSELNKENIPTYFDTTRTVIIRDKLTKIILEVWITQPFPFYKGIQLFVSVENLVNALQCGVQNGVLFELEQFYKEK